MRIFVRILLSFWFLIFLLWVSFTFLPGLSSAVQDESLRGVPLKAIEECAHAAALSYRQGGATALRQQAAECHDGRLIDPTADGAKDLSGRMIPPLGIHSMRRARESSEALIQALPNATLVAMHTDSARADSLIYMTFVPTRDSRLRHVPPIVPFLATGILAFFAAASFVRPITQLSKVAERFGSGDLKAASPFPLSRRKDEIGDLSRILNEMAMRIDALVERYKSFLAQASHELGSPLTRLNIALALARQKTGVQFAPELDRIDYEASRLNDLVQEMLLLARLESGNELGRHSVLFSASDVLREACHNAQFEAEQESKAVTIRAMEDFVMHGYPDLMARALDNVLRNAMRFTPGGGTIEVSCSKQPGSGLATICIQDDGPGIPTGSEETIFEPFVSLPQHAAECAVGSGLGLAIARQAVTANKGRIEAHAVPGRGLAIVIELPFDASLT